MEIVNATALITINETFFVQLISFLVFLYILNKIMVRPLIDTIDRRKGYFSDIKTDIEKAKSDIVNLNRELDKERSQILKEADAVNRRLDAEADHSASEQIASAVSQIAQLRQETDATVKAQLKAVRAQLAEEVDALTTTIMEKVLHRRLQS